MRHKLFFYPIMIAACALVTGCLGSKVLKRGTPPQQNETYPSLRSVPERPPETSLEERHHILKDLQKSYETDQKELSSEISKTY